MNKPEFPPLNSSQKQVAFYFPTELVKAVKGAELFAAFRIRNNAYKFKPLGLRTDAKDNPFDFDPSYVPDQHDSLSALGLPVYGSITFGNTDIHNTAGNQYTGIDGAIYNFDNLTVDCCLVTCEQATNIVKSKITGRPGNVKEYIGLDDWKINITLIFDNPTDQAPLEFIANLWRIKQAQAPIPVSNYYLNLLDINFIVIENMSAPQETGKYSSQTITLTACSDIPLADFLP